MIKARAVNGHAPEPRGDSQLSCPPEAFAEIDDQRPPLVPQRVYDLRYRDFETARMFGRAQKLVIWFTIAEPGDFFEVALPRYYNVTRIIGEPQKFGRFKVGFNSDFLREYAGLFGVPGRLDRIPMSAFENQFVQGKVRTIATGRGQVEIPKGLQYSVIADLRRLRR